VFRTAVLAGAAGYVIGVIVGIALVHFYSSREHDRAREALMTGFFFIGPAISVIAFVVLFLLQMTSQRR
jgi:F0F1-type ATP synthase membrane subunit c/vacuolar-type H+-ATPase subunit K